MTISARVRVVNDYVNKVSASFLPVHMEPSLPGGVFFFLNCQKFRDTVPLKPVKPIAHLSAFHVVDIVKVNDGDGFSGSTRHFFLRFLGSLQQQQKIIIIIFFFLRFLSSLQQQQKIITIIFFLHLSNAKHRRVEKYVFLKSREYIFLALEVLHSKPCRSWGSVWDWMPHGEENRSYPFTHAHTDGQFCHACVGTDS